ncbi:UDP-glucosyltransferase UGT13248-like [Phragmites australis]|uniref:UDP-glucosyltransferase UGT13248-like n=1 Tax=Phragmites australis TaxID=29695 RepID=UPI002D785CDE|nr:UDP-glucosyltransferase UGT13248-like [Phragmites australis]
MESMSLSTTTTTSTSYSSGQECGGTHVLMLPLPAQGHTNPMLQFGRRLAYHGLRPTLVTTRYVLSTAPAPGEPFRVAAISDGFDNGGMASCPDPVEYCRRLEAVGSETLARVIEAEARAGRPAAVLVYDPHMSWARRVARAAGVPTAAFLSQPCAVDLIYGEVWAGRVPLPMTDGSTLRRRQAISVDLGTEDLPPFVTAPALYPKYLDVSTRQFEGLEDVNDVFINSFRDLEPQEAEYMETTWRAKTVGPTLPSFYVGDNRLPSNRTHGLNFFSSSAPSMEWLDKQSTSSVVLASYGTIYDLDATQLDELGNGLCNSGKPFLWVVRSGEAQKLSQELRDKCKEKGLIVSWCPQLEVLAHKATGCFLTHCGWNSTTEAIAAGVPMVAMPQSADQPTIAKYVESAWGIGLRMRPDEIGLLRREEVERCIREVMDGERKGEYTRNAAKWMEKAKEAMQEGGSSDKNIAEFAAKYLSS